MKEYLLLDRKYWKVVLNSDQYYLGRSVIISKVEHEHFFQFLPDEIEELFQVITDLETGMIKAFGATHFNWTALNNGSYTKGNNNEKYNFHLHLRPRYSHPVVLQGYKFLDRNFGNHYERHTDEQVSEELMDFIAESFKKEIS